MWLKICDSHLIYKAANEYLNVREQMEEVSSGIKDGSFLSPAVLWVVSERTPWQKKNVIQVWDIRNKSRRLEIGILDFAIIVNN